MCRQALVVVALAAVVALPTRPAAAQAGLLEDARQSAASSTEMLNRWFGGNIAPDNHWSIRDPVVDDFTDERGQAASLNGTNHRLVLIMGCQQGRTNVIGIGGLGGGLTSINGSRAPNLIFQHGELDLRWGEDGVVSQSWNDADLLLAARGQLMSDFLNAAAQQTRLRVRATLTRNRIIQDEFDLSNLWVSPSTVRMVDPPSGRITETKELSCSR